MGYRHKTKKAIIRALLEECTDEQVQRFYDIFGADIEMIPKKDLNHAIRICEATVNKNWGLSDA